MASRATKPGAADKIKAALRSYVSRPKLTNSRPPQRDVQILLCGELIDADPNPHYNAQLLNVPGVDLSGHEDAGGEPVVLVSIDATELTPDREYVAARAGEADDGTPVYWTAGDGGTRVFPVELTGPWDGTDGYPWKQLQLDGVTFEDADPAETGDHAVSIDGDESLDAPARGVLVATDDNAFTFIHLPGFGCGFLYDSVTGTWVVDAPFLTGDQADTSLITITSESCDIFSFDRVSNYRTDETLVNDVRIEKYGDKIKLTQTKTDYVNWFNLAGVLTDRTAGTPYDETSEVDICEETCCGATLLEVSVSVTDNGDCDFSFDSTVTGGTSPFVYEWSFGDTGTSAVADPTHEYEFGGTYTVTLTVTDACGQRATWTDTVTCDIPLDACSAYTVDATDALYRGVGDSWTGGTYTLTKDGNNWTLISSTDGSSDFCSWVLKWDGAGCATFALSETGGGATCAASIEVCCGATVPDEGCCADVPTILYVTFSGASAPWDVLNGITVQLDYYASYDDVPFAATLTGYGCTGLTGPAWWGTLPTPVAAGGGDTLYYVQFQCQTAGGAVGDYSFTLVGSTGVTCAFSGWVQNLVGGYTETCSPFEVLIDNTDAGQPLVTVTE